MSELVSIIVPVYNTEERLLVKCIDSLINQSYSNLEIIIVDDGSEEATAYLCDTLSGRDSRIKIVHKNNGGLSSARNAGLDVARGKYVSFVDSDDYLNKDSIKYMLEALLSSSADIVCMRSVISDENGKLLYVQGNDTLSKQKISGVKYIEGICHKKLSESVCDKLFDSKLLKERRFKAGRLNEDFFFLSKLLMEGVNITLLDYNGYNYLKHSGTITADKSNFTSLKDAIKNSCELAEYAHVHAPTAEIHFIYSALFQAKVLLSNLPYKNVGKEDWQYGIDAINNYTSRIGECNLKTQDKILINGFKKFPRLTKLIYATVK